MSETLTTEIRLLEEKLLHTNFNHDPSQLDSLLSSDFVEIAEDGSLSSRGAVVDWLLAKDNELRWEFRDFRIRVLADGLVLAVYHARSTGKSSSGGSLRSSLWQKNAGSVGWQMLFHQATPAR